jgi:hypothetical protein
VASFIAQPGHGIDNGTVGATDSMKHWWDTGLSWLSSSGPCGIFYSTTGTWD